MKKNNSILLSTPYILWMLAFTLIPLGVVGYYALTDPAPGVYTFDNLKFAALYEDGFRYFFTVDSSFYFHDLGDLYFRCARRNLDGYRMYHHPYMLEDLFAIEEVWDPARPPEVASIG